MRAPDKSSFPKKIINNHLHEWVHQPLTKTDVLSSAVVIWTENYDDLQVP